MRGQVCPACGEYARLVPVAVHRAWWNPARWIYGALDVIDLCKECAWKRTPPTSEGEN